MATFGQGINPRLGAIDYSPIQRGAAVGAQLAAQGGSMIGQGLANLGQELGRGIEKENERNRVLKEQQFQRKQERDRMTASVKQGTNFAKAIGSLDNLPEGVSKFFNNYATDIANNPNLSLAEQDAAAQLFMSQAPSIISLGLNESKRLKDIQENDFLKQAISLNIEADTGAIDLPGTYETAINLGADPTFAMNSLKNFRTLTPKIPFAPTVTSLIDPVTEQPISVLQTGAGSAEVIKRDTVSPTETRVAANEAENKRVLNIQRKAISLDGKEQEKYLATLSSEDLGAARLAIKAYKRGDKPKSYLDEILNPPEDSENQNNSNTKIKEIRVTF